MEEKDKTLLRSYIKITEEYREQLAEQKRKTLEWEGIARRLFYMMKENIVLDDFKKEWFLNEMLEAQGTLKKEDNTNRH